MPSKSKTKSKKTKAVTPSPRKPHRKVARRAQSRAAHLEQNLEVSEEPFVDVDDGVLSDSPPDLCSRLDNMMNMIVALSQRVNA